jgi:hypothetical protein
MARFILDVANLNNCKEFMAELCNQYGNYVLTIIPIDETNDNQFYLCGRRNLLSETQIKNAEIAILNQSDCEGNCTGNCWKLD